MKNKIIFFLPAKVGGAERITITIAKSLNPNIYDIKFVVLGYKDDPISHFIPKEFSVIYLNIKRMRENSLYKMYRILKKERANYAFASIRFICINLLLIGKYVMPSLKVIARAQISPIFLDNGAWHDRLLKFLYPTAYKIIAQTEEMKEEMLQVYALDSSDVDVLHNPIDEELIKSKIKEPSPFIDKSDDFIFVAVGRCVHQKGYDILIQSFSKVLEKKPNSKLYIIGSTSDQPYMKKLYEIINELSLKDNVFFEGFQNNPYKYVKNANCYILSSRNEGLPNVLLEAIYLKKIVVATKCIPIIERIVLHGQNGFCVDVSDINGLSNAMIEAQSFNSKMDFANYVPADQEDINQIFC